MTALLTVPTRARAILVLYQVNKKQIILYLQKPGRFKTKQLEQNIPLNKIVVYTVKPFN